MVAKNIQNKFNENCRHLNKYVNKTNKLYLKIK